ncbi:DUF4974 domain-containing protein [Prolixibacteraceae bacterium JC049]|nr:DUF4974 domain-containing protein [Prolixibacteraceae bacterium JC049]
MDREKLYRYTQNQISDRNELEEVIQWIEASPEHEKEFKQLKNVWAYTSFMVDSGLEKQEQSVSATKKLYLTWAKYAAVFVLALLMGGTGVYLFNTGNYNNSNWSEIYVPLGESAEVTLPDGTHVWLNSGSKLTYPPQFSEDNRDVSLKGEAFFDVVHNPKSPFFVNTSNLKVEILGTQFNVEAIEGESEVNVTLVKGKVNLRSNKGRLLTHLEPGQLASMNKKKKQLNIDMVNTQFYTSWTKGVLLFKNEELRTIAKKLERWYNITIQFEEEGVKALQFSGTILKNKPIDQILDILKYTSNIDYSIEMKNDKPNVVRLKRKRMK